MKRLGNFAVSERLIRSAVEIMHPNDTNYSACLNNLAELLWDTNRASEAEPLFRQAMAIEEASLGPDHPDVARYLNNLALVLHDTDRPTEAEPLFRRALAIDEVSYGPEHPNVARDLNNLAGLLKDTNRRTEAEPLFRRALEILLLWSATATGHDNPGLRAALNNYASVLGGTGHTREQIRARLDEIGRPFGISFEG